MQVLEHHGKLAGVQISRHIRRGLHLMMDQFVADEYLAAVSSLLPLATVCFIPESAFARMGSTLLRLPIRRRMPYFFDRQPEVAREDVVHFNLSATDF